MTRRQNDTDKFMETLMDWCDAQAGRRDAIAQCLGVTRMAVSNWLHRNKTPRLENWQALQRFADKHGIK